MTRAGAGKLPFNRGGLRLLGGGAVGKLDKVDGSGHLVPREARREELPPSSLSVGELVGEIKDEVSLLIKKQIELARVELHEDARAEAVAVGGMGLAAVGAIIGLTLLLVALVLALGRVMPAWGAGLLVGGIVLVASAVAALLGWHKRVRQPLQKTRAFLKDDLRWAKNRLA